MIKKFGAILALLVSTACAGAFRGGTLPGTPPTQIPVYSFGIVACSTYVDEAAHCPTPIPGARIQVNSTSGYVSKIANQDGYALFSSIIPFSDVLITAEDFLDGTANIQPPNIDQKNISVFLQSKEIDPSGIPLEELAAVRGAMWALGPVAGLSNGLPLGPRPGQADNVIGTVFITDYAPEVQDAIIAELKDRGYTHVVMGPLVDSDGYHGIWQPNDWRGENFSKFLDAIAKFYKNGLKVVVFGKPDGWTFETTRNEFTELLRQPRAQKLIRIFVPAGWEPWKYEASSCTWAQFAKWGRETLPNALIAIHTVADVDAPAGTDSLCNDDDRNWNPGGNAAAWGRVAPYVHLWLTQSSAFANPEAHGDSNHPDRTNFQNWQDLFNPNVRGSYRDRFEHGYAGWPKDSAWGIGKGIRVICAEYSAYWKFWEHRTEAEGVKWGDACIAAGGGGYLDSGSVPVPVREN